MRIGTENVPQLIVLSLESDRLTDKDAVIDTKVEVLNKLHMSSIYTFPRRKSKLT